MVFGKRVNREVGAFCRRQGPEKQLVRACLQSAEGERDNIFGGLEAGNKKAAPNKEENATGWLDPREGSRAKKRDGINEGLKGKGGGGRVRLETFCTAAVKARADVRRGAKVWESWPESVGHVLMR